MNPTYTSDGYKISHHSMYPEGTTFVFSNFTPRTTRRAESDGIVFFGLQYFIKDFLIKTWNKEFFEKSKEEVLKSYSRRITNYLGPQKAPDHIAKLHDLGYLPIEIMAVPEGSLVPYKVAPLVIFSTHEDFYWLPNFLETIMSTSLWLGSTSATTARQFRKKLNHWAEKTGGPLDFVDWQGHDFSMRGMELLEASKVSGAGHLLSFKGTDTIPAIDFLEDYYNADCEKELIGGSVPATEHSVASINMSETEDKAAADITYFRRLLSLYPTGIVSIVSDTFDYWNTITNTARILKDEILGRDGKVVFRPDSGDPVRIVAGYRWYDADLEGAHGVNVETLFEQGIEVVRNGGVIYDVVAPKNIGRLPTLEVSKLTEAEIKGSIQCLYEIFGGTVNEKGFIELDSHSGLIYGDSITLERAEKICQGLHDKGFASTNVVFGIGSFTYQYVTRDTDGWAMKATAAVVNGEFKEIFKDPKTDNGMKKSAKGLIAVYEENGTLTQKDQVSWDEVRNCAYKTVFLNGELKVDQSLSEIRARVGKTL